MSAHCAGCRLEGRQDAGARSIAANDSAREGARSLRSATHLVPQPARDGRVEESLLLAAPELGVVRAGTLVGRVERLRRVARAVAHARLIHAAQLRRKGRPLLNHGSADRVAHDADGRRRGGAVARVERVELLGPGPGHGQHVEEGAAAVRVVVVLRELEARAPDEVRHARGAAVGAVRARREDPVAVALGADAVEAAVPDADVGVLAREHRCERRVSLVRVIKRQRHVTLP